ncbi:hypothetical protein DBV15_11667 [Temnothorax longispinosus]|uniref:Aminopeptidase N-like N-terminal domain-containing protein n=1 Tax=Temnothorax longispinosus TaxID=300112 RepID=A0A4S2L5K7_9HYME|nr:hypothetical protein DBV15_11667 [Temnothorax longispinosus]
MYDYVAVVVNICNIKIGMESFILLLKGLLFFCAATLAIDENSENNDRLTDPGDSIPDNVIPLNYEVDLELNATYNNISFRDLWPMGARRLFPCWDDPIYPAHFSINIKHPKTYKTRFEKTPQIFTYHDSAILLSSFSSTIIDTYIEHRKQLHCSYIYFTLIVFHKVTEYFKSQRIKHKIVYIFDINSKEYGIKHRWIVVTNLWPIGARRLFPCWDNPEFQANFTINIKHSQSYKVLETVVIFNEKEDPLMRQVNIARLLGHAVAYQCLFSNRIGPSSRSYMWLNQGSRLQKNSGLFFSSSSNDTSFIEAIDILVLSSHFEFKLLWK